MTGRNKDSLSSHRHAIPRLVLAMRSDIFLEDTSPARALTYRTWKGIEIELMTGRNKDLTDNRPEREVINRQ